MIKTHNLMDKSYTNQLVISAGLVSPLLSNKLSDVAPIVAA